jgi:hypothetical protein
VAERPVPRRVGDRPGSHVDDPGSAVEDVVELGDGPVDIGEREVRGRKDAVLVVVGPVFKEPAVEASEGGEQCRAVAREGSLHPHAERGEEQGPGEALLVHHPQARSRVPVRGADRVELAEG